MASLSLLVATVRGAPAPLRPDGQDRDPIIPFGVNGEPTLYPDPIRVRDHKVSVCLDAYEHNLLRALAEYQGEQLSVLLRQLVVREAQQVLGGGAAGAGAEDEVATVPMPASVVALAT